MNYSFCLLLIPLISHLLSFACFWSVPCSIVCSLMWPLITFEVATLGTYKWYVCVHTNSTNWGNFDLPHTPCKLQLATTNSKPTAPIRAMSTLWSRDICSAADKCIIFAWLWCWCSNILPWPPSHIVTNLLVDLSKTQLISKIHDYMTLILIFLMKFVTSFYCTNKPILLNNLWHGYSPNKPK